jgi:hypothetical protein
MVICKGIPYRRIPEVTYFDVSSKTYTKRLTPLERDFIRFLQGNKARFLPVEVG